MASEPSSTPSYASPPFDNSKADIILRSSDSVDFRVSSFILEISSEFFANMFDACQAHKEELRDGCPIIQVQEDSGTLDCLLRIIYPKKAPILGDLQRVHAILAAALKYDVEKAIEVAGAALRSYAPKEPLRVWAIAVRHRLEAEARVAADEMVRQCIVVLDTFPTEMQEICAGAYYRLLQYRRLGGTMIGSGFSFCDPSPAQHDRDNTSAASVFGNDPQFISPSHDHIRSLVDVRCRSSDGREFLAHKALLALTSPIMAGMVASISMPVTATHEAINDLNAKHLPILEFEEDGATLKIILGLCYPVAEGSNTMQELLVVRKVVDAVVKYEMDDAMELLRRQWSQLSVANPLQAYLLATHHGSDAEAKTAAQKIHDSTRNMDDYYVSTMEATSASAYRNLLVDHRNRKRASVWGSGASTDSSSDSWTSQEYPAKKRKKNTRKGKGRR